MSTDTDKWAELITIIVNRGPAKDFKKDRALISRGLSSTTESWAIPYVAPYIENLNNKNEWTALLRSAAITAAFTKPNSGNWIPHEAGQKTKLGRWVYEVQRRSGNGQALLNPSNPDPLAARLALLPNQELEEATQTVRRLLTAALGRLEGRTAPPLNYFDLTHMFVHWGNGLTENSKWIRTRPLYMFYSSFTPQTSYTKSSEKPNNAY